MARNREGMGVRSTVSQERNGHWEGKLRRRHERALIKSFGEKNQTRAVLVNVEGLRMRRTV